MKTVVQEALPEIERVGGEEFENEKNTVCCIDIEYGSLFCCLRRG